MKHFFRFVFAVLVVFLVTMSSHNTEAICPCTRLMDPVCGNDGNTYSNRCILKCEAKSARGRSLDLRVAKQGPCDGIVSAFE